MVGDGREGKTNFCTECGWRAGTADGYTRGELTELSIEHFLETGHTINSATE